MPVVRGEEIEGCHLFIFLLLGVDHLHLKKDCVRFHICAYFYVCGLLEKIMKVKMV